jgi:hypothetical protein
MPPDTVEIRKTTLNKFCQGIEEIINLLVQDSVVLNWNEDFITRKFLFRLTENLNGSLITDIENRVVFLTPFKLNKTPEAKFGDIGIIVNIEYEDGDTIEGVAFLEAKKKNKESRNFDAIKWEQLERIFKNAPHSQLLLYDFRDINDFSATGLVSKKNASATSPMAQLPVTKFVSAPINKTLQIKKKNENLYKLSLPLSYQLGYRYLNGFDLEFQNEVLDEVKNDFKRNYESLDIKIPEYLLCINLIPEKNVQEEEVYIYKKKMIAILPETHINKDLYSIIKQSEIK